MIEILAESTESCVGFKVRGKVSAEDYDVLLPVLDQAIQEHGRINLLAVMGDLEGWDGLDAAKADFDLGRQQYRQVDRAAFVGEKKWQEWMVKIMDPFTRRTEEKYFPLDELDQAWAWVEGTD